MIDILSDAEYKRLEETHPEVNSCLTCRGEGRYRGIDGLTHHCNCREQKRLYTRYAHAGIGLNYQRLTWEDLRHVPQEVTEYLEHCDDYVARGIGLFLSGTVGSGKTLIMNLILKDMVQRAYDCYATTFAQTIENFTATWGDPEEKRRFAQRFMRSKVLGIDDLGKEFANRLAPTTFDLIMRTRVQEARPTLFTTNLTPDGVRSGYGASALSLLVEQSIHIHLTGVDFRPEAHNRAIEEVRAGQVRPIV